MNKHCKCGGTMRHLYDTGHRHAGKYIRVSFTFRCDKCKKLVTQRKRQPEGFKDDPWEIDWEPGEAS